MRNGADIAGALRWATECSSPATRGRRLTAFMVALNGPCVIDGCSSIKAAGAAQNVPEATMHALLAELRAKYRVAFQPAALPTHTAPKLEPLSPMADDENIESEDIY